jgi:hypothetical protein
MIFVVPKIILFWLSASELWLNTTEKTLLRKGVFDICTKYVRFCIHVFDRLCIFQAAKN